MSSILKCGKCGKRMGFLEPFSIIDEQYCCKIHSEGLLGLEESTKIVLDFLQKEKEIDEVDQAIAYFNKNKRVPANWAIKISPWNPSEKGFYIKFLPDPSMPPIQVYRK